MKEKTKMHQVELSWNWQKGHFLQIQRVIPGILFIRKLLEAPRARRALLPEAASGRQSLDQMHRRHLQPRLAFSTMIYELLNLSGAKLDSGPQPADLLVERERELSNCPNQSQFDGKPPFVFVLLTYVTIWAFFVALCVELFVVLCGIVCGIVYGIVCGIVCGFVWYCV